MFHSGGPFTINGKVYYAFDRIPVQSLVTRQHKGEVLARKNGPAELEVMPNGMVYMMGVGSRVCFESHPVEGIHFKYL